MLSLCELTRAARVLETRISGAKLQRVVQLDDFRLVLSFRGSGKSQGTTSHVLLSCKPEFARLSQIERPAEAPQVPLSFAQYLRAHVKGAKCRGIRILDEDRQSALQLDTGTGGFQVLLSILGPRSNVYLLDAASVLLYSMRPFEETRPELIRGKPWLNPSKGLTSAGSDRWADEPDENYPQAIERTYSQLERQKKFKDLSRKIAHALTKEAEFLERKFNSLQRDRDRASNAEEYKRRGELLKTVLHAIEPGTDSVTATDFEAGKQITINLDPQLSPAQNLEFCFTRYQKELTRTKKVEQQLKGLSDVRGEIAQLRSEFNAIVGRDASALETLEAFAMRREIQSLIRRYYPSSRSSGLPRDVRQKKRVPARLLPKRYRSLDGLDIWVGRSDEGNDYLTTRLARGDDLFFHLEGSAGSHVVLRTEGRKDPSSDSILDACELAVHFSKLKKIDRAEVHVAPIKNVRKPKGAKPGLVHVLRGKTVHLRRDPKRVERVLASRIED